MENLTWRTTDEGFVSAEGFRMVALPRKVRPANPAPGTILLPARAYYQYYDLYAPSGERLVVRASKADARALAVYYNNHPEERIDHR